MSKQLQDAYIVAASRTPIGQGAARRVQEHAPGRTARPRDPVGCRASAGTGHEPDRRRDHRLRDSRGGAGLERRAHGRVAGRPAEHGRRRDGEPLLRVGRHGARDGGGSHPRRRIGRDDRGRLRIDEHGADDGQQAVAVAAYLRSQRERRHCLRHGPDRREGSRALEDQPRGAGRVLGRVASQGAGRAAVGRVQRRNRRVHVERALPRSDDRRSARELARDPPRRRPARRHDPRRRWRSCVRCSRRRARSRRATVRRRRTARAR